MRAGSILATLLVTALVLVGCTSTRQEAASPTGATEPGPNPTAVASTETPSPPARSTPRAVPTMSSTPRPSEPARTGPDDPRWQFFVDDRTRYRSAWFDGAQRIMIGYGCTRAPFYRSDRRCGNGNGFHHGIDVALPCRTTLRAGVAGRVITPDRPGRPGPAYGSTAFRLRVEFEGRRYDVLIGHATRVDVQPGDRVRAGERIATAGARGAPDGCHLHFEQRQVDGGVEDAVDPRRLLGLRPA